jgi:hypothetical protein
MSRKVAQNGRIVQRYLCRAVGWGMDVFDFIYYLISAWPLVVFEKHCFVASKPNHRGLWHTGR